MRRSQLKVLIKEIVKQAALQEADDDSLRSGLTVEQRATVDLLMKRSFTIQKAVKKENGEIIVILTRPWGAGRHGGDRIAKVNPDGTVNADNLEADKFLSIVREDAMRVTNDKSLKRGLSSPMGFVNVEEGRMDPSPCDCGSGQDAEWEFDGQGIALVKACPKCKKQKLSKYRPEILRGYTQADVDEPIEPEDDMYQEQNASGAAGAFGTPNAFKKKVREIGEEPKNWSEIDNGFFEVNRAFATKLAGSQLPKPGYEKLVVAPDGFQSKNGFVWLALTKREGQLVWSIRDSGGWKLEGGLAILSTQLSEESSTSGPAGSGAGYATPFAFSKSKDGSKRALDVTTRMGFKKTKSIAERK